MIDTKQKAKEILEEYANCYSQVDLERLVKNLDDIKAEAIKEFVQRLKDRMSIDNHYLLITEFTLNNLVKEMVGEGK